MARSFDPGERIHPNVRPPDMGVGVNPFADVLVRDLEAADWCAASLMREHEEGERDFTLPQLRAVRRHIHFALRELRK